MNIRAGTFDVGREVRTSLWNDWNKMAIYVLDSDLDFIWQGSDVKQIIEIMDEWGDECIVFGDRKDLELEDGRALLIRYADHEYVNHYVRSRQEIRRLKYRFHNPDAEVKLVSAVEYDKDRLRLVVAGSLLDPDEKEWVKGYDLSKYPRMRQSVKHEFAAKRKKTIPFGDKVEVPERKFFGNRKTEQAKPTPTKVREKDFHENNHVWSINDIYGFAERHGLSVKEAEALINKKK